MEKNSTKIIRKHGIDFSDDKAIEKAIEKATVEALKMHKLAGNPVAVWQDGKVVILKPEEIVLET
jgi:hypothetical protein